MTIFDSLKKSRNMRRARRTLRDATRSAVTLRAMRQDILPADDLAELSRLITTARHTPASASHNDLDSLANELAELLSRLSPPRPLSGWRGNFEVIVVALSVAMAFRAYYYQPFKIPTGSMQPTLSGISSFELSQPRLRDRMPLKIVNWLCTGEWYKEVNVTVGGKIAPIQRDESKPGYSAFQIAGRRYYIPSDALLRPNTIRVNRDGNVANNAKLWSGVVTAGDFVFVNRWIWNFRHPSRGEVMVFSTENIPSLTPGTHYIKRMCGMPGETISIRPPHLLINGKEVNQPAMIGKIAACEKFAPWAPNYAGFTLPGMPRQFAKSLMMPEDKVDLAHNEYYALGDNSRNSLDSRFWGTVPEQNLLGPATLVYWPFTSPRLGRIR